MFFCAVFLTHEKGFVKIYLLSKAKRIPTFSNININSCYKKSLDSIRTISLKELRPHSSKELHESVVLSILNNSQWSCY